MTNKKFKNFQKNYPIQIVLIAQTKNLMTLEICLYRDMKISKKQVKEFDKCLTSELVPKYMKKAQDDILDVYVEEFLKKNNARYDDVFAIVRNRSLPILVKAKFNGYQLANMLTCVTEDFVATLSAIADYFQFGEKRVKRLIESYEKYKGDPIADASKEFGYVYRAENELLDIGSKQKKKPFELSQEEAERIKKDLEDLRKLQKEVLS